MSRKTTPKRLPDGCWSLTASLAKTVFSNPQPQISYTGTKGSHRRAVHAELLRLAALVEYATIPTQERWVVRVDHESDFQGRVVLELVGSRNPADGRAAAEAMSAMRVLNAVVDDVMAQAAAKTT